MPKDYFQFKHFLVKQDRSAFKVGTDGVLLGAWVNIGSSDRRILDVGTGTGVIAIMLAQRCEAIIDAIEIDSEAAEQATINCENSPWQDRLNVYHISLQEYVKTHQKIYDLIVCNPPYFSSYKNSDSKRDIARHNAILNTEDLLSAISTFWQFCYSSRYSISPIFLGLLPVFWQTFSKAPVDYSFHRLSRLLQNRWRTKLSTFSAKAHG